MDETERDFLWLEDLQSERSLNWVREQNRRTLERYEKTPLFQELKKDAMAVLSVPPKTFDAVHDGKLYFVDQSPERPRGTWKRIAVEDFQNNPEKAEVLLDLDRLSARDGKQWYFRQPRFSPNGRRCLISLADGGLDKTVLREYDLVEKKIVDDGFALPQSKSVSAWHDDDTLIVGGYAAELRNKIGYTRVLKLWKRGQPLEQAGIVYEGSQDDLSIVTFSVKDKPTIVMAFSSWEENKTYLFSEEAGLRQLHVPSVAGSDFFEDGFIFKTYQDFGPHPAGTVLWISIENALCEGGMDRFEVVAPFDPQNPSDGFMAGDGGVFVFHLQHATHAPEFYRRQNGRWMATSVPIPKFSSIRRYHTDPVTKKTYFAVESFTAPVRFFEFKKDFSLTPVSANKLHFNGEFETHQHFATSADGTKVPYFVVHKKGLALNGRNPTYLTAYGGFMTSQVPYHQDVLGKLWLERGGVFILGNIRGGGEYGAQWYASALRENRQRCYDDFIAVAEDAIERGYTRPASLGISGRSNGGLLVGAVTMQRPDLFAAVYCGVPLLDMFRYHRLPPGASWMNEYGDPDTPVVRAAILKYSPYQNASARKKYPEILFVTATTDDRVHPSHARRMAAKMQELGHPTLFYEEGEGGHAGGSIETKARGEALRFAYFWEKLGPSAAAQVERL